MKRYLIAVPIGLALGFFLVIGIGISSNPIEVLPYQVSNITQKPTATLSTQKTEKDFMALFGNIQQQVSRTSKVNDDCIAVSNVLSTFEAVKVSHIDFPKFRYCDNYEDLDAYSKELYDFESQSLYFEEALLNRLKVYATKKLVINELSRLPSGSLIDLTNTSRESVLISGNLGCNFASSLDEFGSFIKSFSDWQKSITGKELENGFDFRKIKPNLMIDYLKSSFADDFRNFK